jgi:hypothetical protein
MPIIFVTIVNYNGEKDTLSCLKSLNEINATGIKFNVIVLDNGSREIFNVDKGLYKNFKLFLIKSENNLGFAGGQNLAIKHALVNGADYVVVLNNDVIADNNLLIELLQTFQDKSDCGLVSPKIYFAKGHEFHKDKYKENELGNVIWYAGGEMDWRNVIGSHRGVDQVDTGQYDKVQETDFASGCCVMIKKEVFERVGLFDENYFLYYEDNDFSQRVKAKGFKIYYQPKAKLWHLNAGSAGGSGSLLQDYFITRNRLLFGFKYSSTRARLALLRESIKFVFTGRDLQKKAAFDFYMRRFGKGSYQL